CAGAGAGIRTVWRAGCGAARPVPGSTGPQRVATAVGASSSPWARHSSPSSLRPVSGPAKPATDYLIGALVLQRELRRLDRPKALQPALAVRPVGRELVPALIPEQRQH